MQEYNIYDVEAKIYIHPHINSKNDVSNLLDTNKIIEFYSKKTPDELQEILLNKNQKIDQYLQKIKNKKFKKIEEVELKDIEKLNDLYLGYEELKKIINLYGYSDLENLLKSKPQEEINQILKSNKKNKSNLVIYLSATIVALIIFKIVLFTF